jgi:hypothetical protein
VACGAFERPPQVAALPEPVVFNCTGWAPAPCSATPEIMPVKGVLVVLLPQPEVTYNILGGGGYMFPRADGIILGGTFDRGDWTRGARARSGHAHPPAAPGALRRAWRRSERPRLTRRGPFAISARFAPGLDPGRDNHFES